MQSVIFLILPVGSNILLIFKSRVAILLILEARDSFSHQFLNQWTTIKTKSLLFFYFWESERRHFTNFRSYKKITNF